MFPDHLFKQPPGTGGITRNDFHPTFYAVLNVWKGRIVCGSTFAASSPLFQTRTDAWYFSTVPRLRMTGLFQRLRQEMIDRFVPGT